MMSAAARTLTRTNAFLQAAGVRLTACGLSTASPSGKSAGPSGKGSGGDKNKPLDAADCPERKPQLHKVREPLDHNIKKTPFDKKLGSVPDDNKTYHAYELYSYHTMSFYDLERDMSIKRLPQPSSIKPKGS